MKHWINKNYRTLIITAFLIPIIIVAIVSISHVTKWYGISNPASWAIYLSVGIEIAALSSIAAISANMGNKIYFPFIVVTIIQFIGNIFFSYQYIDMESNTFKSWVELAQPVVGIFGIEQTDIVGHKRFLALFAGGLMPVISLSFLHFLVKFTEEGRKKDEETSSNQETIKTINPVMDTPIILDNQDRLKPTVILNENIEPTQEPLEDLSFEEEEEIIDKVINQPNIIEETEIEEVHPVEEEAKVEKESEIIKVEIPVTGSTVQQTLFENSETLPTSDWEKKNNYIKSFLRNVKNSKRIVGHK